MNETYHLEEYRHGRKSDALIKSTGSWFAGQKLRNMRMSIMESSGSFSWIYKFTDDMTKILPQLNQSCLYFRKGHQILNQGSAERRILLL